MKPRMPNTCQVKQVKTEFKNPIILTSALIRSLMTCAYSVPNCSKPDRHEAEKKCKHDFASQFSGQVTEYNSKWQRS